MAGDSHQHRSLTLKGGSWGNGKGNFPFSQEPPLRESGEFSLFWQREGGIAKKTFNLYPPSKCGINWRLTKKPGRNCMGKGGFVAKFFRKSYQFPKNWSYKPSKKTLNSLIFLENGSFSPVVRGSSNRIAQPVTSELVTPNRI